MLPARSLIPSAISRAQRLAASLCSGTAHENGRHIIENCCGLKTVYVELADVKRPYRGCFITTHTGVGWNS